MSADNVSAFLREVRELDERSSREDSLRIQRLREDVRAGRRHRQELERSNSQRDDERAPPLRSRKNRDRSSSGSKRTSSGRTRHSGHGHGHGHGQGHGQGHRQGHRGHEDYDTEEYRRLKSDLVGAVGNHRPRTYEPADSDSDDESDDKRFERMKQREQELQQERSEQDRQRMASAQKLKDEQRHAQKLEKSASDVRADRLAALKKLKELRDKREGSPKPELPQRPGHSTEKTAEKTSEKAFEDKTSAPSKTSEEPEQPPKLPARHKKTPERDETPPKPAPRKLNLDTMVKLPPSERSSYSKPVPAVPRESGESSRASTPSQRISRDDSSSPELNEGLENLNIGLIKPVSRDVPQSPASRSPAPESPKPGTQKSFIDSALKTVPGSKPKALPPKPVFNVAKSGKLPIPPTKPKQTEASSLPSKPSQPGSPAWSSRASPARASPARASPARAPPASASPSDKPVSSQPSLSKPLASKPVPKSRSSEPKLGDKNEEEKTRKVSYGFNTARNNLKRVDSPKQQRSPSPEPQLQIKPLRATKPNEGKRTESKPKPKDQPQFAPLKPVKPGRELKPDKLPEAVETLRALKKIPEKDIRKVSEPEAIKMLNALRKAEAIEKEKLPPPEALETLKGLKKAEPLEKAPEKTPEALETLKALRKAKPVLKEKEESPEAVEMLKALRSTKPQKPAPAKENVDLRKNLRPLQSTPKDPKLAGIPADAPKSSIAAATTPFAKVTHKPEENNIKGTTNTQAGKKSWGKDAKADHHAPLSAPLDPDAAGTPAVKPNSSVAAASTPFGKVDFKQNLESVLKQGPSETHLSGSSRKKSAEGNAPIRRAQTFDSVEVAGEQQPKLTHMTKSRPKGPKRRLPKAATSSSSLPDLISRSSSSVSVRASDSQTDITVTKTRTIEEKLPGFAERKKVLEKAEKLVYEDNTPELADRKAKLEEAKRKVSMKKAPKPKPQ